MTCLIEVCRPFNIRCHIARVITVRVSTPPLYLQLAPWISQYIFPQRMVYFRTKIFKCNADNGPSIIYSVSIMYRRKDLWDPDGTSFPVSNDRT